MAAVDDDREEGRSAKPIQKRVQSFSLQRPSNESVGAHYFQTISYRAYTCPPCLQLCSPSCNVLPPPTHRQRRVPALAWGVRLLIVTTPTLFSSTPPCLRSTQFHLAGIKLLNQSGLITLICPRDYTTERSVALKHKPVVIVRAIKSPEDGIDQVKNPIQHRQLPYLSAARSRYGLDGEFKLLLTLLTLR